MTREEAIDIIKCLAWHTRPDEEDVEQAIKALEQELVLDKIKTEIEKRADDYFSSGSYDEDLYNGAYIGVLI